MRRSLRRTLLIAAAAAVVLAVVAAAGLRAFARSDRLLETARAAIERSLGRRVAFSSLAPSFWPGVGVTASDVAVYEADGETPLLTTESLAVRVRLLPLLWRSVRVSTVALRRPRASLVRREDGTWNIEDLFKPERPPTPPDAPPAPPARRPSFTVSVGSVRVRDGVLTASDPAWGRPVVVRNLDLTASGIEEGKLPHIDARGEIAEAALADLAASAGDLGGLAVEGGALSGTVAVRGWAGEQLRFRADLAASGIGLRWGDVYASPADGLDLAVSARGVGSLSDGVWDLKSVSASALDGRLTARGFVAGIGGVPKAELTVAGASIPWEAIGSLDVPGLALGGAVSLEASISSASPMEIGSRIDLRASAIDYGAFRKEAGVPAALSASLVRSGETLSWSDGSIVLGSLRLSSEGSYEMVPAPLVRARLSGRGLDLGEAGKFVEMPAEAGGTAEADLAVEYGIGKPPAEAVVTGTVKVPDGRLAIEGLPRPVLYDAVCTFTPGAARLGVGTARLGSSVAEGYIKFDLKDWPRFDSELNFPVIDTADFSSSAAAPSRPAARGLRLVSEAAAAVTAAPAAGGVPPFLMQARGRGKVTVGEIRAGKLTARNGRAAVRVEGGTASLDDVVLPFYGGRGTGNFSADLRGAAPRYALRCALAEVDVAALLADVHGSRNTLSGKLAAELAAAGEGDDWETVSRGMRGEGRFRVTDGTFHSFGFIRQTAPLLLLLGEGARIREIASLGEMIRQAPGETRFTRCEGSFIFEGDSYGTGDLLMEIRDGETPARLHLEGEMGLGGELSFMGFLSFPRGSAPYERLAPYFPDDGGWIELPFPVPVGGTLAEPRIDIEASRDGVARAVAGIGALRLRKEVERKIDRVLEPKPREEGAPVRPEDVGRELLRGTSKEMLKRMLRP
ncbi:MAG: AsmA family protein [bacterium]|nr:AsmA family protein [bacterium]